MADMATTERRSASRLGRCSSLCTGAALAGLVMGSVVAVAMLLLSPRWWIADVALQVLAPAWLAIGGVGGAVLMAMGCVKRRRRVVVLASAVVALGASLWLAAVGWHGRRLLPYPSVNGEAGLVTVIQLNLNARGSDRQPEALAAIAASGADVVVITEFGSLIWSELRTPNALSAAYPHFSYRDWVPNSVPGCLVLSKWPIERLEVPHGPDHEQVYLGRIDAAAGAFVVAQIAPHSPRSAARWSRGNELARAAASVMKAGDLDGPVVLACDLNSTPMGVRSRVLRSAGLAPGKPVWVVGGTWPAGIAGIARLRLDDVWVGGGAEVTAWRTAAVPGSDHRWVEARIRLVDDR